MIAMTTRDADPSQTPRAAVGHVSVGHSTPLIRPLRRTRSSALFVRRQRALAVPMLELSLFGNRTFRSAITMTVCGGIMAGTNFFVYQYLQTVQHLQPLHAALWLLPSSVTIIVGLNLAPRFAQRIRPAYVIAGGLVFVAIGYLVVTRAGDGRAGLAVLVAGLVISAVGIGPMAALGAGLALGSVPMDKAGSAAAMNEDDRPAQGRSSPQTRR